MSPDARILWADADGDLLTPPSGEVPPSGAALIVVVAADAVDPDPTSLTDLVLTLGESGFDALCRVEPLVDALVEIDGADRVVGHLDRDRHVRSALPQVVAASWWPRLAGPVSALVLAHRTIDLAALVIDMGGRVAPLEESAFERS